MEFRAYTGDQPIGLSYDERGEICTLSCIEAPNRTALSRDEITEIAYAYLGRHPSGRLYITDADNRLLDTVICEEYGRDLQSQADSHLMGWTLCFLCALSFLGTVVLGLSWVGLIICLGIGLFYMAQVKLGINNYTESAFVCTIILVLVLLLVPAVRAARNASQRAAEKQHRSSPAAPSLPEKSN